AGAYLVGGHGGGSNCAHLYYGAGGGGSGYYGGGGGGDVGGGGGGGSSYPGSAFTFAGITFTPISNIQGNAGSGRRNYFAPSSPPDSIGMGGWYTNGGNGLIIIIGGNPSLKLVMSGQINP